MKKWETIYNSRGKKTHGIDEIIDILLENRGITTKKKKEIFLHPPHPKSFSPQAVGIDKKSLTKALARIKLAIHNHESIVVYTDYDADGITAGAIMWKSLHALGANVMPYTPHRETEGYGLSKMGLDAVMEKHHPQLIITVDHGVTAWEKVEYAKQLGIDVIITDHHVLPEKLPDCTIVHTANMCGAGVSWFVAKELLQETPANISADELLALAAIGTIADMVPLVDINRSIAAHGLTALNQTSNVGLQALYAQAQLTPGAIDTFAVSFILTPRINAMGRLVHALDALRLLCTTDKQKAVQLATKLGETNRERQQLTFDSTLHAKEIVHTRIKQHIIKKILIVDHDEYNVGVIGLIAGKLVEEFYRPAIVISRGDTISKASARSVKGYNIIAAIRNHADLLVDAGGHPMAAGFTIETQKLAAFTKELEKAAEQTITADLLKRTLQIDLEIPFSLITQEFFAALAILEPFGMGNPEPVFATKNVVIQQFRTIGKENKHLKLLVTDESQQTFEALAFNQGALAARLNPGQEVALAYTLMQNTWNEQTSIQLKIKDIQL